MFPAVIPAAALVAAAASFGPLPQVPAVEVPVVEAPAAQDPAAQDPVAEDPAAEDPVARLTERLAALDSFALDLTLESSGSGKLLVELRYQAPDRARMVWHDERQRNTLWFVDGVLSLRTEGPTGAGHASFDAAALMAEVPSIHAALAREFPECLPGPDLGAGPLFHLDPNLSGRAEGPAIEVTLSFARTRPALFCWGFEHRARLGPLRLEEGRAIFGDPAALFLELSADRGIPTGGRARGGHGDATLELDRFEAHPELDPAVFEVPDPPPGSKDIGAGLAELARRPFTPVIQRRDLYQSLQGMFARGDVHWSEDTAARLGRVFRDLHRQVLPRRYEEFIAQCDTTSAEEVERILGEYGARPVAERRQQVAETRGHIEDAMRVKRTEYVEALTAPTGLWPPVPAELLDRLLALEREVGGALFDETVAEPILADYDRRVRTLVR